MDKPVLRTLLVGVMYSLLLSLKRSAPDPASVGSVRVVGVDEWSWRKGPSYGTIMVDLERREVLDVLQARSADSTAPWLRAHPAIARVSRDRCDLYAQAAARGASQAHKVADRFHLLQNFRHSIEQQLGRGPPSGIKFAPPERVAPAEPSGLYCPYGLFDTEIQIEIRLRKFQSRPSENSLVI